MTRLRCWGLLQVMPNHLHGVRVLLDHEDNDPDGSDRRALKVKRADRSSVELVAGTVRSVARIEIKAICLASSIELCKKG